MTVALPKAFAAVVKVSTPFGATLGCAAKRALLSFETWKVTLWPDSFGPAEIALAHPAEYAPESSLTATLPPPVNDGASLTGVTVMVNVCGAEVSWPPFAVPPLSRSVTVTVALP